VKETVEQFLARGGQITQIPNGVGERTQMRLSKNRGQPPVNVVKQEFNSQFARKK
jgi:hypothetical protein